MPRKYLLSADGCPACGVLKHKLADKIKSGKVKVVDLSSDSNFHLVKELGVEFVPELVTVSKNGDGTFSVKLEDDKIVKLDKWDPKSKKT